MDTNTETEYYIMLMEIHQANGNQGVLDSRSINQLSDTSAVQATNYKRYFNHDYAYEVVIRKSLMYSLYRYPCKVSAFLISISRPPAHVHSGVYMCPKSGRCTYIPEAVKVRFNFVMHPVV